MGWGYVRRAGKLGLNPGVQTKASWFTHSFLHSTNKHAFLWTEDKPIPAINEPTVEGGLAPRQKPKHSSTDKEWVGGGYQRWHHPRGAVTPDQVVRWFLEKVTLVQSLEVTWH